MPNDGKVDLVVQGMVSFCFCLFHFRMLKLPLPLLPLPFLSLSVIPLQNIEEF